MEILRFTGSVGFVLGSGLVAAKPATMVKRSSAAPRRQRKRLAAEALAAGSSQLARPWFRALTAPVCPSMDILLGRPKWNPLL
jgi:hypothetical protein